ncbi:sigma-70 family RNA polymerase sigma factor [Ampullimonas aquatilis]|uniref:sigma-70 family RNA polymerase sigma factor n=1 Tax=Ampullimonas aquatilis TaxID=1341549 RepID=UPI003C73B30D
MDLSHQRFNQEIARHQSFLLGLAKLQLNDTATAEDAVQETLSAAWLALPQFKGQSSVRTWLVSILRFKIIDQIRLRQRNPLMTHDNSSSESECDPHLFDPLFDNNGRWAEQPSEWHCDPCDSLEQQQLLSILNACMTRLPSVTAQVFLLREYIGFEIDEVAEKMAFSQGNVRTMLYRARMSLRTCLDLKLSGDY